MFLTTLTAFLDTRTSPVHVPSICALGLFFSSSFLWPNPWCGINPEVRGQGDSLIKLFLHVFNVCEGRAEAGGKRGVVGNPLLSCSSSHVERGDSGYKHMHDTLQTVAQLKRKSTVAVLAAGSRTGEKTGQRRTEADSAAAGLRSPLFDALGFFPVCSRAAEVLPQWTNTEENGGDTRMKKKKKNPHASKKPTSWSTDTRGRRLDQNY